MRLRSLHRAFPSLHPFGVVHWVPEQLNIKAVTGACKLIDGCSLALCSATVSVVSAGICQRNEVNSIAWLHQRAQPKDSIHYITLHYITIIILGVSSSEELIERGLKFVLKLFFDKITFNFLSFIYFSLIFFINFLKLFWKLFLSFLKTFLTLLNTFFKLF